MPLWYLYPMRLALGCLIFTCCLLEAFPLPQERARAEFDYEDGELTVEADRLSRESATRWAAEGNVIITYQDSVIRAPRILYDPVTGEVIAEGSIELTQGLQWLKGTRAELNLRTNTGTIFDAEGFTDKTLYVKAKRLIKTGPESYTAQSGILTACEEAIPKWSFAIRQAHIQQGGNARLSHTVFKVMNVPLLYFPVWWIPTGDKERSSGFMLPTTGNSTNKGRRVSQSYYLVLGRSADLMLHEDYFSKRGFGHGLTFRTRPNPVTSLTLDWYWVKDRLDQGGTMVNGIGETQLPHGFRAVTKFNFISSFLFRQIFSDNFDTATLSSETSKAFVTKNTQSQSFNFLFAREETNFAGPNVVIRNTPTLNFKLLGRKLPNLPLYLDLDSSAEGRSRSRLLQTPVGAPSSGFFETPGITQRLDFFPRVYFSVPLFQGLRATPGLGFRDTLYSSSLSPSGDPNQDPLSEENINRRYLELTVNLEGWGLSKVASNSSGGGWKHLIEPSLQFRSVIGVKDFNRIIRFDEHDAIANTNEIEYGLLNRFFVKGSDGQVHEWLSLKIAQKYFFDSDFDGALQPDAINQFFPLNTLTGFPYAVTQRNYSPVTALLRFTPKSRYNFDVRGDYDPKFTSFRNFSVTGSLTGPAGLSLATTYYAKKETPDETLILEQLQLPPGSARSNTWQGQIRLGDLQRGLSGGATLRYDLKTKRFLSNEPHLNYFWDCCGVTVAFRGFNIAVREEKQILFSLFLKGIGDFGTLRRLESLFYPN